MIYIVCDLSKEEENEEVFKWEKIFIEKVVLLVDKLFCFEVYYFSEWSLDDVIFESSGFDIMLVLIIFILMIIFVCVMLGKFLNLLIGYFLFVNVGVFVVVFGILVGFGLVMWC